MDVYPECRIQVPETSRQIEEVRRLMRAFVEWHRNRHQEDTQLIDQYFDAIAFEEELESLPGKYSPPKGKLLLATYEGAPAGCVALRGIDSRSCEMKRMFVYTQFHGKGLGRALAEAIIEEARNLRYERMLLDTSVRQIEAITLYKQFGFQKIPPYYGLNEELRNWLVFMELKL